MKHMGIFVLRIKKAYFPLNAPYHKYCLDRVCYACTFVSIQKGMAG